MKKILVVDDDEGILAAFRAMLESAGYEVETSPDHECLLDLGKAELPDLILLDVLLSGADGRDLCLLLKKSSTTRRVPIIMVSAHPTAQTSVLEVGADDFLAKPFEMEELLSKVAQHIS